MDTRLIAEHIGNLKEEMEYDIQEERKILINLIKMETQNLNENSPNVKKRLQDLNKHVKEAITLFDDSINSPRFGSDFNGLSGRDNI